MPNDSLQLIAHAQHVLSSRHGGEGDRGSLGGGGRDNRVHLLN